MTTITCVRCGGDCERVEVGQNVWHHRCPNPDCTPWREPRWRFVLGIGKELGLMVVLAPYALARAVWRRLR